MRLIHTLLFTAAVFTTGVRPVYAPEETDNEEKSEEVAPPKPLPVYREDPLVARWRKAWERHSGGVTKVEMRNPSWS